MAFKKPDVKAAVNTIAKAVDQNSPTILTGLAVAGFIGTIVLTVKAVPKAEKILAEHKKKVEDILSDENESTEEEIKAEKRDATMELVKKMAPVVVPPVVTGVTAIACCIGSNSVNLRRQAVLSAAYNVAQTTLTEYKDKLPEIVGPGKAAKVEEAIAADKVKENPPKDNQIIFTGKGDTLCYDEYSGRYFKSDPEKIRRIINDLNEQLISCMYINLNDFYRELGLSDIKLGDDFGWNIENGQIGVKFTSTLTEDDQPVLVLSYDVDARTDYRNLH